MINWKKIDLPFDRRKFISQLPEYKPFLVLWKGAICLCEFDVEIDRFFIGMMPASYLGFWKLDVERESKMTHWVELQLPKDY